ncbi:MAG: tRNA (adenosine(37)-N6)-threonylcarbamoyltransferase complex ATPase subunit type 1 TsaE [Rhodocyclaceae bacterium]
MIELVHPDDSNQPASSGHPARFVVRLADEADTEALGASLAPALSPGLVVYLVGDLGAGKTTLVRGLLRALGHEGKVKSPTYTLIEPYTVSSLNLYHFDFYRFTEPEEYLDTGLDEYFAGSGACLVEWPDKASPYVAKPDVEVRLTVAGSGRIAEVSALTEAGRICITTTKNKLAQNSP